MDAHPKCPYCKRVAWQSHGGMGGGIMPDSEGDTCVRRSGRDCRIAQSGGAAALADLRERESGRTHPQLIESLYAERDAAMARVEQMEQEIFALRDANADLLSNVDGLMAIATQTSRELASAEGALEVRRAHDRAVVKALMAALKEGRLDARTWSDLITAGVVEGG